MIWDVYVLVDEQYKIGKVMFDIIIYGIKF